ncbi:MAG: hypothetical protein ACREWG_12540 [Gammaproteobacteria bacterium]
MALLTPDPHLLGLASPALGPWFKSDSGAAPPTLIAPAGDLSVTLTLPIAMQWRAAAGCTVSYFVATPSRPAALARLRQADGTPAFGARALVVLATLLPEVELRLAALSNLIVSPRNAVAPAGQPGRPTVRHLALEIALPAAVADAIALIGQLRETGFPGELSTDAEKAAYVGLTLESGALGNSRRSTAELHRPSFPGQIILQNGTSNALGVKLWSFDDRGRALDPGAVAAWWNHLASGAIIGDPLFANLWADPLGTGNQTTASLASGYAVQFCSAHEGPIAAAHLTRLNLGTGIQVASAGSALYSVVPGGGLTHTIGVVAPTGTDLLPMPRVALLPNGPYRIILPPGGTAGPTVGPTNAALFTGWVSGAAPWNQTLQRDFARVAVLDVESHLVGLTRDDAAQADIDKRVSALRNTAATPFLATADAATNQVMVTMAAGPVGIAPAPVAMAPVMDIDWSGLTPAGFGASAIPNALVFTVHAVRGEGIAAGDTVSGQKIVIRFPSGSLPTGGWVRIWPHGLDTATGQRFRLDGGGAIADLTGRAFVVTDLPDGTAAARMSFDVLVVTANASRYYLEQRFDRPVPDNSGAREPLPVLSGGLPPGFTPWMCELGASLLRGGRQYVGGGTLLGIPANATEEATGIYALILLTSLDPTDVITGTLRNSAGAGDQLIVTSPAFLDTPEGGITVPSPRPTGTTVLWRKRDGLGDEVFDGTLATNDVTLMGRPVPTMERREVAAVDPVLLAQTGVIAAVTGRAKDHEAIPAQLGHPGMPAAAEIHGTGIALAGPAAGQLVLLMRERVASNMVAFIRAAAVWHAPAIDPGGTTTFVALLETLTYGVTGDGIVRALLAEGVFLPGQGWDDKIKGWIETKLGVNIDPAIDLAVADDTLARTKAGVDAALKALLDAAPDNVRLFTPTAGSGRRLHMASTTVVIDDVFLVSGTAHLWRRGLTFDSSLSVALFDEAMTLGRCTAVRAARRRLLADRLALTLGQVPDDPAHMVDAVTRLNAMGGLQRVVPDAYVAAADTTSVADLQGWNPNGRPGGTADWFLTFTDWAAGLGDDFNNAIR